MQMLHSEKMNGIAFNGGDSMSSEVIDKTFKLCKQYQTLMYQIILYENFTFVPEPY